jgi:hypothetical protein
VQLDADPRMKDCWLNHWKWHFRLTRPSVGKFNSAISVCNCSKPPGMSAIIINQILNFTAKSRIGGSSTLYLGIRRNLVDDGSAMLC